MGSGDGLRGHGWLLSAYLLFVRLEYDGADS